MADEKSRMRRTMRGKRRALAVAAPEAGAHAAQVLPISKLPAYASVAGYWPQGSEIDPWPLMQRLTQKGAILALPRADSLGVALVFAEYDAAETLLNDAAGIPSPPPSAPLLTPDLIIVPLLAFDRQGGRLGQGGGHYDRTIAELRARKPVFVLGLAYAGQAVERLPTDAHDQPLDAILTETGYIEVSKR